jgi:large repetitive protein
MKFLHYLIDLFLPSRPRAGELQKQFVVVGQPGLRRRSERGWGRALGLLLLTFLPLAASAQATGAAFSCDGTFYIIQQGTNASGADRSIMSRVNRVNGVVSFTQVMDLGAGLGLPATTDFVVNSLAYNSQDGYMYALTYPVSNTGFPAVSMYRIGQGGVARVGTTTITINGATPAQFPQFAAGVFDKAGNYYVAPRNIADTQYRNSLFKFTPGSGSVNATTIPLLNSAGTTLNPSATYNVGTTKSFIDLAFNPINNTLYGTYGLNMLYTFDLTTTPGSARVTQLGANPDGNSNIGSAFFDISGTMFGYANEGGFYAINTTTGAYSLIDTDNTVAVSDGASCINPVQRIDVVKEVTSVTRVNATTYDVTYTLRLRNTGTVTDTKVQVTDFLRSITANTANTTFPTSTSVTVSAAPVVTNLDGSTLAANTAFNGQGTSADLLTGSQSLTAGQRATITFTARVVFSTVPSAIQNNNAYASSTSGPAASNEGYVLLADGTLVPPADLIASDASTDGANLPPLRANINDAGDTPSPTPIAFTPSIFGTVFEDVNYGGGAGRSQNAATGIGRPNARVELYNGSGLTATFVSAATTDANGNYSFLNLTAGNTYTVRVVSNTVTSSRTGAVAGLLPVQTFVNGNTSRVGGEDPLRVDGGNVTTTGALISTLNTVAVGTTPGTTAQSITAIALPAGVASPITNVDFGFNFDVIVNTNAQGQGSLAQFITNANALGDEASLAQAGSNSSGALAAGKETSIFMITDGAAHSGLRAGLTSQLTGLTAGAQRAVITQTSAVGLPVITGANATNTVIDGTTQTFNIANSNTTAFGTATTVGTDGVALAAVSGPEVEIAGNNVATVLDIEAANTTVRGVAIRGGNAATAQTILIGNTASATGYLLENNAIGTNAISNSATVDATASVGYGINVRTNAGSGLIQNNSIAYTGYSGINLNNGTGTAGTTQILSNRFEQNGYGQAGGDGVTLGDNAAVGAGPSLIQGNLFISPNSSAVQFEIGSTAASTVNNNTITGAGTGGAALALSSLEGGGIVYLQRDGTKRGTQADVISKNVITASQAAGIVVGYGQQNVTITQNSTAGNGGLGIDEITNPVYFVGSGNATGAAQYGNGDGVSSNDGTIGTATSPLPNRGLDYPIFTSTSFNSGTSATVTGYIGNLTGAAAFSGATIEIFVADNTPANQDGAVSTGNTTVIAHGEGVTYVGSLTADAAGNFTGTITAPAGVTFTNATLFTATARLAGVGTSEFGPNRRLNTAPVAVADVTNTPNNTAVTFAVSANDTDADGNGTINPATIDLDPATAGIQTSITIAGQGTFTTVGVTAGSVKFTPVNNTFTGVATTPYTIQDVDGATSNSANLSVNVGPLTANDASSTAYNVATSINVTTNDTDANTVNVATVDLDPTTAGIQTTFTTANGTFTVATTGIVTYTPNAGSVFVGTQSVNYVVFDNLTGNAALSSIGTYTVTLTNAAPVAVADVTNTPNNTAVTFPVTANDTDANGNATINQNSIDLDPATAGIQTSFTVAGGTFTTVGAPAGSVTFTPINSTFTNVATTPYTILDVTGQVSNSANLSVNVGPLTANDASSTGYNAAVSLNVTTNDTDANGKNVATVDLDPTTAGIQTSVDYVVGGITVGTFTVATTGIVTYTPAVGSIYVGTASVNYVFLDNVTANPALSSVGTYTVTLTNGAPVAVSNFFVTPNNTPLTASAATSIVANDTDPNGNATINPATVDLDPTTPGILDQLNVPATNGGGTFSVNALGQITFTPINANYTDVATISYTVQDLTGQVSNSTTVSVNVGPRTADDAASTSYNAAVTTNVTANDVDVQTIRANTIDLDPTTPGTRDTSVPFIVGGVTVGTFSTSGTSSITYTPAVGSTYVGTASIQYLVYDAQTPTATASAYSNPATYTVTLTNAAPVAVDNTTNTPQATAVTFSVTANDTDPNGNATINPATVDLDPATLGIQTTRTVTGEGTFTVDNLGNVTFTPIAGFTGISTISYTVQDNIGLLSNAANIAVNVGPLAQNDVATTGYNALVTTNVTANDTDVQGIRNNTIDLNPATPGTRDTSVPFIVGGVTVGTFSTNGTSSIRYTPAAGSTYVGTASITYLVYDGTTATNSAYSNPATYTVTLTNTAPVAVNDANGTIPNQPVTFNISGNDTDANGNTTIVASTIDLDPNTAGIQTSFTVAGQGTFTTVGAPLGSVTFTPATGFNGTATTPYTIQDEIGATSNQATITVSIAGAAFTCNSAFYRVTLSPTSNTSVLERLDRTATSGSGLTYTSVTIYDTGVQLNALFLNYTDGYLYAFGLGSNRLYRLSTTGIQDLGPVAGLPTGGFNAATADLSGNAYLANNSTTTLYRLQVATLAVTPLTLTQAVNFGDMGFNPADGNIYASRFYPGGIYKVDLITAGATRPVTLLGGPATTGEDVGSIFFDASGFMYAATNQGTLAAYDTQTGATASIGTASVAAQSDGASCVFPVEEIDVVQSAAVPVRVDATTFDVTFTTRVRNTGAVVDPNVQINDFLTGPDGTFPTASSVTIVGTPTITGAGAATLQPNPAFTGSGNNTGLLTGTNSLAINATAIITYTVRVTFPSLATVPTATQYDQVYVSTAGISPNPGYAQIGGLAVPPSQILDGDASTNSTTPPATPNGDTPSPTPIVFNQPLAFDDVYLTPSNTPITVNPVSNDQPGNSGSPLVATTIDLNPAAAGQQTTRTVTGGTFDLITTGAQAGQVTFTPNTNFTGTSTVQYTVADAAGNVSSIAPMTVHVGPRAVANTSTTDYNVPVSVNVTTNDVDVDGVDVATVDLDPTTPGIQTTFPYVVGGVTVGTFTAANTGVVTYTPAAGATYTGTAVVSYTVQDTFGATSNVTTYTVTLTNDAPVAVNDTRNTPQATPITFSVTANDTDLNGNGTIDAAAVDLDPATAGIQHTFTVAGQGTFTADNLGNVTFAPVAGFTDVATITYTVSDNTGQISNTATIAVNVGPLALNETATTAYNVPVSVNVTTNDFDANGLRLNSVDLDLDPSATGRQTSFTVAGQGTFTVNATGLVTFTPSGTYVGTTSVNYVIFDALTGNAALSNVATFTVTTTNAAPVAVNDTRNTPQATPITFSVTANDTDADGNATINVASVDLDPATAGIQHTFTVAGQGTFTADNLGNVTFAPVAGFTDVATIPYTVSDNTGQISNTATIAVNVGPLTQNDVATTGYTTNVQLTVLANDADANGLNAALVDLDPNTTGRQNSFTVSGQGTFTVNAAGVVTFNPIDTFVGTTTISYVVFDALTGNAALSNVSTITVTTTNTAPVAVNDTRSTPSNTPITFNPSANDTDANGNGTVVDASVDLDPATPGQQTTRTVAGEGTYSLDGAGLLTFTPALNFTGTSSISYTVLDNQGLSSNVATITINVGPLAVNDVAYTAPNTAGTINVTTNDSDANGVRANLVDLDPATNGRQNTFTVPGEGVYAVNASGVVTFTPALDFTGTSTINYTVQDQTSATSNVATITFHVGPLAANDAATTAVNVPVSLSVVTNDVDVEGVNNATVDLDPTTASIQTTRTVVGQGTFTVDNAGLVTFTPTGTFTGTTAITYTVQDVNGATSNVATITITLQNAAPVAVADEYNTPSNTSVTFSATSNDTDAENNLAVGTVDLNPGVAGIQTTRTIAGEGTFTVDNAGNVTFAPALNFTGSSTISYTVQDATGATSAPVTITVHVGPIATNDTATSNFGQAVRLTAGTSDIDAEGVNLATVDLDPATPGIQTTFTVAGQGTFAVDGTTGQVIFTPDPAFAGSVVSIPYVVSDVNGAVSNPATLSVNVTPYNDVVTTISGTTTANAGDPVTYVVSTVNNGPSAAQNVVVRVQLPTNLRNVNGTPFSVADATYSASTGLLVYNAVPTLASGQTVTNSFAFRMPDLGLASGVASSTANGPADADFANNNGSQSPAIIVTNGAPLPVELISFTAKARRQDAVLNWATAQEQNSAYFVVERSFTGRDFEEIARRTAAGTTLNRHDYAAVDANIGRTHSGLVYYRLRQVDTDGTTSYSEIEVVSFAKAVATTSPATVYPNPTVGDATLDLSAVATGPCVVTVFDAAGRAVLAAQTVEAGGLHPLSIAGLPVGTYLVRLQTADGQAQTLRLMRQ